MQTRWLYALLVLCIGCDSEAPPPAPAEARDAAAEPAAAPSEPAGDGDAEPAEGKTPDTGEDKGDPGTNDTFKIEIWLGVVDTESGPPTPKHLAKGVLGGGNIRIQG